MQQERVELLPTPALLSNSWTTRFYVGRYFREYSISGENDQLPFNRKASLGDFQPDDQTGTLRVLNE